MLLSGLRSSEVLGLRVADVDIARRWVRVTGKGDKQRSVPIDTDVAGAIQTYLLAERPDTDRPALFVVGKGPNRGQPLTPAGLRTVFRYHRQQSGVSAGHPHALRHSFGTALAEAGVDLSVIQALMGNDHVDSSAAYIHLAPSFLREEFDAARARLRTRDVDHEQAVLLIRESKFGKSRLVPLQPSTMTALQDYLQARTCFRRSRREPGLFVGRTGKRLIYQVVGATFRQLLTDTGVGAEAARRPRLHDLRHRFAIVTLVGWYRSDEPVQPKLPVLSTYLGHREPSSTYWYLSAAPELLALAVARRDQARPGARS
jgi:site-specific recombinase XerD